MYSLSKIVYAVFDKWKRCQQKLDLQRIQASSKNEEEKSSADKERNDKKRKAEAISSTEEAEKSRYLFENNANSTSPRGTDKIKYQEESKDIVNPLTSSQSKRRKLNHNAI